jgi:hypothetical protein
MFKGFGATDKPSVHLLQMFTGSIGSQDHDIYVMRLVDRSILEAPYRSVKLPLLMLSTTEHEVFLF